MSARTVVLLDTGPLVALVDANDDAREPCVEALKVLPRTIQFVTVSPVLTQAFYLVSNIKDGPETLFNLIDILKVSLEPVTNDTVMRIRVLMKRYQDLPMDFADAALVTTAETLKTKSVFTLDQRGFRVYRQSHTKHFDLLPDH